MPCARLVPRAVLGAGVWTWPDQRQCENGWSGGVRASDSTALYFEDNDGRNLASAYAFATYDNVKALERLRYQEVDYYASSALRVTETRVLQPILFRPLIHAEVLLQKKVAKLSPSTSPTAIAAAAFRFEVKRGADTRPMSAPFSTIIKERLD